MRISIHHPEKTFYGAASLGEKGQIVIPAEARKAMKLHKGEKLLVFGIGEDMIAFSKLSGLEKFANKLNENIGRFKAFAQKEVKKKR